MHPALDRAQPDHGCRRRAPGRAPARRRRRRRARAAPHRPRSPACSSRTCSRRDAEERRRARRSRASSPCSPGPSGRSTTFPASERLPGARALGRQAARRPRPVSRALRRVRLRRRRHDARCTACARAAADAASASWRRSLALRIAAQRRTKAFDRQLPDVLATIASTLRAGHGLRPALRAIADDGAPPASEEFARVLGEERLGRAARRGDRRHVRADRVAGPRVRRDRRSTSSPRPAARSRVSSTRCRRRSESVSGMPGRSSALTSLGPDVGDRARGAADRPGRRS